MGFLPLIELSVKLSFLLNQFFGGDTSIFSADLKLFLLYPCENFCVSLSLFSSSSQPWHGTIPRIHSRRNPRAILTSTPNESPDFVSKRGKRENPESLLRLRKHFKMGCIRNIVRTFCFFCLFLTKADLDFPILVCSRINLTVTKMHFVVPVFPLFITKGINFELIRKCHHIFLPAKLSLSRLDPLAICYERPATRRACPIAWFRPSLLIKFCCKLKVSVFF